MKIPTIAIVGRPNVGKSSLLNALAGKRIAIVEDVPGVTRDRVSAHIQIDDRWVELVDTGGYGFIDPDQLTEHIHQQIELAMTQASLVVFLVDCGAGLVPADAEVAELLRSRGIRTVLVANKADSEKADTALGEFARLGLGTPIGVSAMNARNIDQVVSAIRANVDLSEAPRELPEPQMLLAIVGKRNAGKSTLVNAIARLYEGDPQRVIVSELPGTTRDSIDVRFEKDGKTLVVIDTAGVRKKRQMVTHDLEFYGFHRAQRSIRRADVVLLLIDATEPLSEPDRKLASYVDEQFKPVILVVNKWDRAQQVVREVRGLKKNVSDRELMEEYREYLRAELRYLPHAPIAFTTASEGRNVQAALDMAGRIFKESSTRITTGKLNQAVRAALAERQPGSPGGKHVRIYYATQIDVNPPTVVIFVNHPEAVDAAYQRFLVNRLRQILPWEHTPIRLIVRQRLGREPGEKSPREAAPL